MSKIVLAVIHLKIGLIMILYLKINKNDPGTKIIKNVPKKSDRIFKYISI